MFEVCQDNGMHRFIILYIIECFNSYVSYSFFKTLYGTYTRINNQGHNNKMV